MDILTYQRTVFGFHGCDKSLVNEVLTGKAKLSASANTYDWLARGIYFREHGPMRVMEWAILQSRRKNTHIKEPAVIGAVIQLGMCFDLLDVRFTHELARHAATLEQAMVSQGIPLPQNQRVGIRDGDWLRRERDCFVLKYAIPEVEREWNCQFDSVRGVFQEGAPAFKGAGIKLKSHIQIAVREPRAIIGYFLPDDNMLQFPVTAP